MASATPTSVPNAACRIRATQVRVHERLARPLKTGDLRASDILDAGVQMLGKVLHLVRVGTTTGERLVELRCALLILGHRLCLPGGRLNFLQHGKQQLSRM